MSNGISQLQANTPLPLHPGQSLLIHLLLCPLLMLVHSFQSQTTDSLLPLYLWRKHTGLIGFFKKFSEINPGKQYRIKEEKDITSQIYFHIYIRSKKDIQKYNNGDSLFIKKGQKKIHVQIRDEPKLYYSEYIQGAGAEAICQWFSTVFYCPTISNSGSLKEWYSMRVGVGGSCESIIAMWWRDVIKLREWRNETEGSILRKVTIRPKAWGIHAGKSHKSYLVSYRTITPDSALVQHWEKLKSRDKEEQMRNSKAGRKREFLFSGRAGEGAQTHGPVSHHSQMVINLWGIYNEGCILNI